MRRPAWFVDGWAKLTYVLADGPEPVAVKGFRGEVLGRTRVRRIEWVVEGHAVDHDGTATRGWVSLVNSAGEHLTVPRVTFWREWRPK